MEMENGLPLAMSQRQSVNLKLRFCFLMNKNGLNSKKYISYVTFMHYISMQAAPVCSTSPCSCGCWRLNFLYKMEITHRIF